MVDMFTPGKIGGLELKNRIVRSATWEALGDQEGRVTDKLIERVLDRVRGGVGLFILGITSIAPEGIGMMGMTGIYSDDHMDGHTRLVEAVHDAGGRISIQLAHVGAQGMPADMRGLEPVGPSAVQHPSFNITPRALTTDEVKKLIDDFGKGAQRALKAGYDAIQVHGAHGYLVNQFLSPRFNKRDDEYGEGKRFALDVYEAVRANAGTVPVHMKLNIDDFIDDSVTPEISLPLAKELGQMGIDAIEVSGGMPAAGFKNPSRVKINNPDKEAYFFELAAKVKAEAGCAVIGVGGYRSPEVINRVLGSGDVDFVSMARPFVREPGLVNRWQDGDLSPAHCVSCNLCFTTPPLGDGIQCKVLLNESEKKGS